MISVRRRLLMQLLIALVASSIVISIVSYFSAREEVNELFDAHLVQIAKVLEQQKDVIATSSATNAGKKIMKGEAEFLIQIWTADNKLIYSSHPLIDFPPPTKFGLETRHFMGHHWRSYGSKPDKMIVEVSQPFSARREMLYELAGKMLMPILLQFPILGLLIWLAVGRSLGPLRVISAGLKATSEKSMQPLSLHAIPEEVMPLVLALNDLLARLDTAMTLQRRFIADAAHELRTPLTAVQLQLQLLDRTQGEAEKQEAMNNLTKGVERSIRLVEQLLAFARLEAGNNILAPEKTDVAAACQNAVAMLSVSALRKNIDIGILRQEETTALIHPDSLRTVVENLLTNAIRYTPEGGRVDVSAYAEGMNAVIEVADNGPGIPAKEIARIFDRFYRVPGSKTHGTGLGLAIVQSILQKHNGTIAVIEGIDGKGCCFRVALPLFKE